MRCRLPSKQNVAFSHIAMLRGTESGLLPVAPPVLRACVWALADIYTSCWCFVYEAALWEQPDCVAVVALGWPAGRHSSLGTRDAIVFFRCHVTVVSFASCLARPFAETHVPD